MEEKNLALSDPGNFAKNISALSGYKLGALLGFGLATIYFWGIALLLTSGAILFSGIVWIYFIGIVSISSMIGTLTGWALDKIIRTWTISFSPQGATLFGLLICFIFALPLNLKTILSPSEGAIDMLTINLPSLIYIFAGGWLTSVLYDRLKNT